MTLTAHSSARAIPLAEALHPINGTSEEDSQGLQFRARALTCPMGVAKGPMENVCLTVIYLNYKWKQH